MQPSFMKRTIVGRHLVPEGFQWSDLEDFHACQVAADWWGERGEVEQESELRKVSLLRGIVRILLVSSTDPWHDEIKLIIRECPQVGGLPIQFEIEYGQMYDPPPFNLGMLVKLGELLGTMEINVDNYAVGGCETCDYNSDYGHTLQVYDPTKNVEILRQLATGTNLLRE